MLFLLYPKYKERILKIIKQCFDSEDKDLIKMGAYCLSEMFILKNEFADVMDNVDSMSYHLIKDGRGSGEGIWGIEDEISKLIIGLYDETAGSPLPGVKNIAKECLDIWDLMFEKQIGPIRQLSQELMEGKVLYKIKKVKFKTL